MEYFVSEITWASWLMLWNIGAEFLFLSLVLLPLSNLFFAPSFFSFSPFSLVSNGLGFNQVLVTFSPLSVSKKETAIYHSKSYSVMFFLLEVIVLYKET